MPNRFNNDSYLRSYRKENRSSATPAEAYLWACLKNSKLANRKFRRQHSIGNYIVDFYCPSEKLIIELDGADHLNSEGIKKDAVRDQFLRERGFRILRFENAMVFDSFQEVFAAIRGAFENRGE